jgi:hypothetical protein
VHPPGTIRAVTVLFDAGRLWIDVTAELPVASYPAGQEPDPGRVAGVDLGIIHPYAVAADDGSALWCPGGRSGANTAFIWPTPNTAAAPPPPGHHAKVSAGHGGGATPAAGPGWSRAGTVAGRRVGGP